MAKARPSTRAKWRALRSAGISTLEKVLDAADIVREGCYANNRTALLPRPCIVAVDLGHQRGFRVEYDESHGTGTDCGDSLGHSAGPGRGVLSLPQAGGVE